MYRGFHITYMARLSCQNKAITQTLPQYNTIGYNNQLYSGKKIDSSIKTLSKSGRRTRVISSLFIIYNFNKSNSTLIIFGRLNHNLFAW